MRIQKPGCFNAGASTLAVVVPLDLLAHALVPVLLVSTHNIVIPGYESQRHFAESTSRLENDARQNFTFASMGARPAWQPVSKRGQRRGIDHNDLS
jgi:hypothetical protein